MSGTEDIIVTRHQSRTNFPLQALWLSEPILDGDIYNRNTILLSWYNNSDIFIPPWVLHDPLNEEYFMWSDDIGRFSWKEKTEMGNVALFVATNSGKDGKRGLFVQELMKYVKVDSTGTYLHNAEVRII